MKVLQRIGGRAQHEVGSLNCQTVFEHEGSKYVALFNTKNEEIICYIQSILDDSADIAKSIEDLDKLAVTMLTRPTATTGGDQATLLEYKADLMTTNQLKSLQKKRIKVQK